MKKELSVIEIRHYVGELEKIVRARVDRLYQYSPKDLLIQLHKTGVGKLRLRLNSKGFVYFTDHKSDTSVEVGAFCKVLRRHLENARLISISQLGFERILELGFETRHGIFRLIVECFSKGNIILTDSIGKIISAAEYQHWSTREIKKGHLYKPPEIKYDLTKIDDKGVMAALSASNKESLVKFLAVDLGLGGTYSEELCLLAGIYKQKAPKELAAPEAKRLLAGINELLEKKSQPLAVFDDGILLDVVPFRLQIYKEYREMPFETFNEAIDFAVRQDASMSEAETRHSREIKEFMRIIREQEENIKYFEEEIRENTWKGELLYNKYSQVDAMLKELRKLREAHSWQEIRQKLKGSRIVKEINEKEGKVMVDIQ